MDSQDSGHMYFTNLLSQDPQLDPTYGGQSGNSPMTIDVFPPLPPNEPNGVRKSSVIQKATNKFCAKLAQVEGLNQSGMTEQDKFEKAKIMYQSVEKCSFQFEHCWHLLKDQPKKTMSPSLTPISTRCSASTEDSVFDLETENVIENEVIELDRPMSRKLKKGNERPKASKSHVLRRKSFIALRPKRWNERLRLEAEKMRIKVEKMQSKIRQEDERLRLEAEKVELAKKESDQRIMMMNMSVMPEMQRLYFQQLQREIMMRRINWMP
ncbi:hypothetical protein CIPAW_07G134100 [Carya illinoinensis]|uniref:No apical meristem-associated C-terminal domain-containing protein n=1 Tax=Carya illinoinensis TaxID=32201 RepID=A0A8T1Q2S0_CARIL|nr:hypothetical protein CIPAW_07G134100 [Carya illinoinensis]